MIRNSLYFFVAIDLQALQTGFSHTEKEGRNTSSNYHVFGAEVDCV